jgi:lipopolysaccharide biosynthesis protein
MPVFPGHYQPRLPGELGFYDLRVKDVMRRQIEILKQYGLYGFCFHHYWFGGRRVMRVPYDTIMSDKTLNVPFCLHWANEPWTIRWDGCQQGGVLLAQKHDAKDDIEFIKDILPALQDERYIRVNGKPLLIVYRPRLFPDAKATVERWRAFSQSNGIGELYLVMMQTSFEGGEVDPEIFGFDASIEYLPHNLPMTNLASKIKTFAPEFKGGIYDYEEAINYAINKPAPTYKLFRGIMPEWDCTPRLNSPNIFINCSPGRYQKFLEKQIAHTIENKSLDEKFIFINAWNEWAEGAYLEPDRKYGYGYLNATYRAANNKRRIAVKAHLWYEDLFPEIISYLKNIPQSFELFVTTSPRLKKELKRLLDAHFDSERVHVKGIANRGRDISGFLCGFKGGYRDFDLVCVINDKKSLLYGRNLQFWRKYLYENMIGSFKNIQSIWSIFDSDPNVGVVYSEHYKPIRQMIEWGSNYTKAQRLLFRAGIQINQDMPREFPSGSLYWFRPKALVPLFELGLKYDDFDEETGQADGTLAHAIERCILFIAEAKGYYGKKVEFYNGVEDENEDRSRENFILRHSLNEKTIALFGAGEFGRQILAELQRLKLNVCGFIDNNSSRWGETLDGIKITSPEEYERGTYILVTSLYCEEIKKQLFKMGLVEAQDFLFLPKYQMLEEISEYANGRI